MPKINRRRVLKGAGSTTILCVSGCTQLSGNGGSSGSDENIKIGVLSPSSGALATAGEAGNVGTQIAVDEINNNGGINGRNIELEIRDTETDPGVGVDKAQELINSENVDLLFGAFSSGVTLGITDVATRNEVLLFNATSTGRGITGEKCSKYIFRYIHNQEEQAISLAKWAYNNLGNTMEIAYLDFAGYRSARDWAEQIFEEAGGEITNKIAIPFGEQDMSPYISQVDTNSDILYALVTDEAARNWIEQGESMGLNNQIQTVGTEGLFTRIFETDVEARQGMIQQSQYPVRPIGEWDTPLNQEFIEEFKNRFDDTHPWLHPAVTYSRTKAFAKAAQQADFADPGDYNNLISEIENLTVSKEEAVVAPAECRKTDHDFIGEKMILEAEGEGFTPITTIRLDDIRGVVSDQCEGL